MLRGYQAVVLYRSPALYFRSNSIVSISTVGFSNEENIDLQKVFKRYFES